MNCILLFWEWTHNEINQVRQRPRPSQCFSSLVSICMLCTQKLGPKYKISTVCTFQMNWVMRSNNKISLCCGDSEMAIIQQCSHFRQRTFSYIMHPNHCIFPPFWATMHISSSQWNIKHSYDLIFSSKRDFSLYTFFTSLVSPLGANFRGCLYLGCLFTEEMFDWLMLE